MSQEPQSKLKLNGKFMFAIPILAWIILMPFIALGGASVAVTCSPNQFVSTIGATSANCAKPIKSLIDTGTITCVMPAGSTSCPGSPFGRAFDFTFPIKPRLIFSTNFNNTAVSLSISEEVYFQTQTVAPLVWANMPAGETPIYGNTNNIFFRNFQIDYTLCSPYANVATPGTATAVLRLQHSSDGATWIDIVGSDIPISATGIQAGAQFTLPIVSGIIESFWRIVGLNGNGVLSPAFGVIGLDCDYGSPGGFYEPIAHMLFNSETTGGFMWTFNIPVPITTAVTLSNTWLAIICQTPQGYFNC